MPAKKSQDVKEMEKRIASMWRHLRLECLRIHGQEENWKREIAEGTALHGKAGWQAREAALEIKYEQYLADAKAKLKIFRIEIETEYALQTGKVAVAQAYANQQAAQKVRNDKKTAKKLMTFNHETGGTTVREVMDESAKPVPKKILEPPGGVIEPEGIPKHWKLGPMTEFTKPEIAWAIQCTYLTVGPHDAPTPAAWTLLMMARTDPTDFFNRWGERAMPKKDAEETEKRFDDNCEDLLTDLHSEMSRMAAETVAV